TEEQLALTNLDGDSERELARELLLPGGGDDADRGAQLLARESAGHPLFLYELARTAGAATARTSRSTACCAPRWSRSPTRRCGCCARWRSPARPRRSACCAAWAISTGRPRCACSTSCAPRAWSTRRPSAATSCSTSRTTGSARWRASRPPAPPPA